MKKIIAFILAITMIFGMFSVCASAEEEFSEEKLGYRLAINDFTNEKCERLFEYLKEYPDYLEDVETISLFGTNTAENNFSDVTALVKIIESSPNAQQVYICNCNLSDFPTKKINTNITSFSISSNISEIKLSDLQAFSMVSVLEVFRSHVKNLDGIQYFKNLECLSLPHNEIDEISAIKNMSKLVTRLTLSDNHISNIYPLEALSDNTFQNIGLSYNNISDCSALYRLKYSRDKMIDISGNYIDYSYFGSYLAAVRLGLSNKDRYDKKDMPELPYYYDICVDGNGKEYAKITAYYGDDKILNVPETIENIPVKIIDNNAFRQNMFIESVNLPDSIVSIGDYAFYGCYALKELKLPENLTALGEYAFARCKGLKGVAIPDGLTKTGYKAFSRCYEMENVFVANPDFEIGKTFYACNDYGSAKLNFNLNDEIMSSNDVSMKESITAAGYTYSSKYEVVSGELTECDDISEILHLPDGIHSVNVKTFEGSPISVIVPHGVTSLESLRETALSGVSLVIPDTVTNISSGFVNNSSDVKIYYNVESENTYMKSFSSENANITYDTDFNISFDTLNRYNIDESATELSVEIPKELGLKYIGFASFFPRNEAQKSVVKSVKIPDGIEKNKCLCLL